MTPGHVLQGLPTLLTAHLLTKIRCACIRQVPLLPNYKAPHSPATLLLAGIGIGHDDGLVCPASIEMRSAGAISKRMQLRRQQLSRRLLRIVPQWPPLLIRPLDSNPRHAPQISL